MKIKKVFNNNVLLVENGSSESVVIGKGLGFQKKVGQIVDEGLISQVYQPVDERWSVLFKELLQDISPEYVEVASQIINLAEAKLQTKFNGYVLIALSDHIHFAVERMQQNMIIKNELLLEIERFYPQEYQIGQQALTIINELVGVMLPLDEAGFIALKFIEKRSNGGNQQALKMTQLISDIITIVQYQVQMTLDVNSISYQRFIVHLRYFVEKILTDESSGAPEGFDIQMQEHIIKKYPQAYRATQKIQQFIQKTLGKTISGNEEIYLTIHIQRILTEIS